MKPYFWLQAYVDIDSYFYRAMNYARTNLHWHHLRETDSLFISVSSIKFLTSVLVTVNINLIIFG